jgi:hypothetical protein
LAETKIFVASDPGICLHQAAGLLRSA